MRLLTDFFFLALFFVLLVVWLFVWAVFHLAGGPIHLLIVFAVIALIVHMVRGHRAV